MNFRKNKRHRNLSILLIPDDNADPLTFQVSFKLLKILTFLSIIIIIHVITGTVFYYKFFVVNKKNTSLNIENTQLKEDNKKMYSLYDIVDDFLKYQNRVRTALGINKGLEISNRKSLDLVNNMSPTLDMFNGKSLDIESSESESQLDFLLLTETKSRYHDFAKNVPTFLPVQGILTTNFQGGDWFLPNRHLGIDIAANLGAEVKAAADGVVLFANWTNDLGYLLIIDHLNGFLTYYGHNQVLLKRERSIINKGDIVARVGNSGKSTAPHLHFEIWKEGVAVNPKEYLLTFQN